MYKNISGTLKGLAVVEFILGVIGGIILGIMFISLNKMLYGFLVMVIVGFASYLASLPLYALGYISERITYLERGSISSYTPQTYTQVGVNHSSEHKATSENDIKEKRIKENEELNSEGLCVCIHCGTKQKISRGTCWNCGKSLIKDNETDNQKDN